MPVVRNTVPEAGGRVLVNIYVCDLEGRPIEAFDQNGLSIASKYTVRAENNAWEATLPANVEILPAGTIYKVTETWQPGSRTSRHLIRVPPSPGPHDLGDILVFGLESPEEPTPEVNTSHYTHVQGVPAATWYASHGLNRKPPVTVVDSSGKVVYGDVTYVDANNVRLDFSGAFSGTAEFGN